MGSFAPISDVLMALGDNLKLSSSSEIWHLDSVLNHISGIRQDFSRQESQMTVYTTITKLMKSVFLSNINVFSPINTHF